jgi:hypothetical protein
MLSRDGQITHLFRIENPNLSVAPHRNGQIWHEDVRGTWFHPEADYVSSYITQAVGIKYEDTVVDGARLATAHIPTNEVENFRADRHPMASKMWHLDGDYIVPRDGSVDITELSVDSLLFGVRSRRSGALENLGFRGVHGSGPGRRIKALCRASAFWYDIRQ